MNIVVTILGCLLGVAVYLLLGLVSPITHLGDYSVGIEVAICLIMTSVVGALPVFRNKN